MSNPYLPSRQLLLAKLEAVTGTPEALADADVMAPIYSPEWTPTVEMFEREVVQPSHSRIPQKAGERSGQITFSTELKGSGAAGTVPPHISTFLQACGFSETVVPVTSVTYAPTSVDIPSITIALQEGGVEDGGAADVKVKQLAGARGTVSISAVKGQPVMLNFTFTGKYFAPTETTVFNANPGLGVPPITFLNVGFTFQGVGTLKLQTVELDIANDIQLRNDVNDATGNTEAVLVGRSPTGSIDPEQVPISEADFFDDWTSENEGILQYVLTGAAGNICTVTAPAAQITNIADGDRDSLRTEGLELQLNQVGAEGDDELTIVFT